MVTLDFRYKLYLRFIYEPYEETVGTLIYSRYKIRFDIMICTGETKVLTFLTLLNAEKFKRTLASLMKYYRFVF